MQLTNLDLGRIVNGLETDPVEKCAFEHSFTPERIEAAFRKIGAAPLTRAGLKHKKVRHEVAAGDPGAIGLLALAARLTANTAAVSALGANAEVFVSPLPRRRLVERPVGEVAQLAALCASGVTHTTVWHTCGAVALDGDLVLAAEGVRAAAEHTAAVAAEQEQGAELLALRVAARALERGRIESGSTYSSMNGEARSTIIKCLFKLKHLTGYSKLASKASQLTFLDEQGDISALLEAEVAPHTAAAPAATAATPGDTTEVDTQIAALLARRIIIKAGTGASPTEPFA